MQWDNAEVKKHIYWIDVGIVVVVNDAIRHNKSFKVDRRNIVWGKLLIVKVNSIC